MSIRSEDKVVKYSRFVFRTNRLPQYDSYWIDTKDLENLEVKNQLCHVEIDLYPKHFKLSDELKNLGLESPPKFKLKRPNKPKIKDFIIKIENDIPEIDIFKYGESVKKYRELLEEYKIEKRKNRFLWRKYRKQIYEIIHKDIKQSKTKNIKPITIFIDKKFIETQNEKNEKIKLIEKHYVKRKN